MKTQVILIAIGSAGDVFPMLALGQEMQRRHHHVAVMTNPLFKTNVGQAGLEFIDLGSESELRAAGNDKRLHQSGQAWKLALQWGALGTMRQTVSNLRQRHQRCKTLLVASPLSFGARLAADAFEIPLVSAILSPFVLRSKFQSPVIKPMWLGKNVPGFLKALQFRVADRFYIDPLLRSEINELQNELGLPISSRFLHRWCFSEDLCLGAFPDQFAPPQPDWPSNLELTGHYVWDPPFPDQQRNHLKAFTGSSDQPILVVSAGSAGTESSAYYQRWIKIAGSCQCRLLLLERNNDLVPTELPARVLHMNYCPLDEILPRAAVVVHSGGIGATLRTWSAGVPQLVIPRVNDQFDNAARVAAARAGIVIDHRSDEQAMRAAVTRLLSREFKTGIANPAGSTVTSADSVAMACDRMESIFYRHS